MSSPPILPFTPPISFVRVSVSYVYVHTHIFPECTRTNDLFVLVFPADSSLNSANLFHMCMRIYFSSQSYISAEGPGRVPFAQTPYVPEKSHIHIYIYTYIYILYIYIYICTFIYIYQYICTYIHPYIIFMCIYIHIHLYAHVHESKKKQSHCLLRLFITTFTCPPLLAHARPSSVFFSLALDPA